MGIVHELVGIAVRAQPGFSGVFKPKIKIGEVLALTTFRVDLDLGDG